jgi:hypothetical protein
MTLMMYATEGGAMQVEVIRELEGWKGDAVLVKKGEDYFVVSSADVFFSGPETLVFPANPEGEVEEFLKVAGGKRVSREEAIEELANLEVEA